MKDRVDDEIVRYLWWLRPVLSAEAPQARRPAPGRTPLILNDPSSAPASPFGAPSRQAAVAEPFGGGRSQAQPARVGGDDAAIRPIRREEPKVGRNERCPCGSGKKYKKCHGAAA